MIWNAHGEEMSERDGNQIFSAFLGRLNESGQSFSSPQRSKKHLCTHWSQSDAVTQHGHSDMCPVLCCVLTCSGCTNSSCTPLSYQTFSSWWSQLYFTESYPTGLTSTLVPVFAHLPSVHGRVAVSAAVSGGLLRRYPFPQREAIYSTCRHAVHCGGHTLPWVSCRCTGGAGWHLLWSYHWGQL